MPRLTLRPLTQKLIDSTALPANGYTSLRDHGQRGLEVWLWSTGTRSWRFEYLSPVTSKKAVLSLPAGTLAEARVIAKSHRALVALGRDPALEAEADLEARREAHAKAVNIAAVLDDYERNVMASSPKHHSRRNRVRVLRRAMEVSESAPSRLLPGATSSSASTRFKPRLVTFHATERRASCGTSSDGTAIATSC